MLYIVHGLARYLAGASHEHDETISSRWDRILMWLVCALWTAADHTSSVRRVVLCAVAAVAAVAAAAAAVTTRPRAKYSGESDLYVILAERWPGKQQ